MQNRLVTVAGVALVAAAVLSGCSASQTVPRKAARLTIDGATRSTRPPACSQEQSYRTIDIRAGDGSVQATLLLSGDRAIPQWVKIRNVDGFDGSYWSGGVGDAQVDLVERMYTISGTAYGISNSNPNKVVTTDFTIIAEC